MQFKEWLDDAAVIQQIESVFGKVEDVGLYYIALLPTGQEISFFRMPDETKLGVSFDIDDETRTKYGSFSTKDTTANQGVMPGSIELGRKLKELYVKLKQIGITLTYTEALTPRRKKVYDKFIGRLQKRQA